MMKTAEIDYRANPKRRGMGALANYRGAGPSSNDDRHRVGIALEEGSELVFSDTQLGNNSQRNLERNGFKLACTRIIYRKHLR